MSTTSPAKIMIVDDHPLIREGLAALIAVQTNLEVCGEAADVAEALTVLEKVRPDLIIVDLSLKTGHGLDLIKALVCRGAMIKILVVSNYDESLYAERALRAGADGYIGKLECGDKVIDAIHTVLDGRRYLSRRMTERLVGQVIERNDLRAPFTIEQLTDRELQVFELIGKGRSTGEIAQQLHLSRHTIDTHREKIKGKLNLKTGAELTRRAVQRSLEIADSCARSPHS